MPEMQSPDGTETLPIPPDGVAAMTALGWTTFGPVITETESTSDADASPPKRGPGRPPRKD